MPAIANFGARPEAGASPTILSQIFGIVLIRGILSSEGSLWERGMIEFKGSHFGQEIIGWGVRW